MKDLVVFDTNVFVSYFWTSNETSAVIKTVERIEAGYIMPVFSNAIMAEYRAVLHRKRFNFPPHQVTSFLQSIENNGLYVDPPSTIVYFADITDKPFYDAAVAAGAWLVTGNKKHFPDEPFIVSPREYLERTGH